MTGRPRLRPTRPRPLPSPPPVQIKGVTRAITAADSDEWVPVAGFECRGLEPTRLHPGPGFAVVTASGAKHADVDLSEGEWVEYDAKLKESVGVYGLEARFEVSR